MFKIGKIKKLENEEVIIKVIEHERSSTRNGKHTYVTVKSLAFRIVAGEYSFIFVMNKDLKQLLDMPMNETIDFSPYLFTGETFFDIGDKSSFMDPPMDIKINRYLDNCYEITVHFDTSEINSITDYSGFIQFDFDLDNFLEK